MYFYFLLLLNLPAHRLLISLNPDYSRVTLISHRCLQVSTNESGPRPFPFTVYFNVFPYTELCSTICGLDLHLLICPSFRPACCVALKPNHPPSYATSYVSFGKIDMCCTLCTFHDSVLPSQNNPSPYSPTNVGNVASMLFFLTWQITMDFATSFRCLGTSIRSMNSGRAARMDQSVHYDQGKGGCHGLARFGGHDATTCSVQA